SKSGGNGHLDYLWAEDLGRQLRVRRWVPTTGGCEGLMEAVLQGFREAHAAVRAGQVTETLQASGAGSEWAHGFDAELCTIGGYVGLAKDPNADAYDDRLVTFERFLFRTEFLYRNKSAMLALPGGFETLTELFGYLALKEAGVHADPVLL